MNKHVMIVHADSEMILMVMDIVERIRAEGHDLSIAHAKTQKSAEQLAQASPVDLLVTDLEISHDEKTTAGAGEQQRRGLELFRTLRIANPNMAGIIITPHVDEVFDLAESEGFDLVKEGGEKIADRLRSKIIDRLGSCEPEKPRHVDLEISLSTDKENGCYYQFQPEGQLPRRARPLIIHPKKLTDLVEDCRDVHFESGSWKRELKNIGEALAAELFNNDTPENQKFVAEFNKWVGRVGGLENIRVRFTVEDLLHPIVLEALKQATEDKCWMLKTAVYRMQEPSDDGLVESRGLFQDKATREGPINFLIIQADLQKEARPIIADHEVTLGPLPKVPEEVAAIKRLLAKLKEEGHLIGEVRVIKREDISAGGSFKKLVEEVLDERGWHVLHYAGHTHFDLKHQAGYLFFPGSSADEDDEGTSEYERVVPIKVDEFAWKLKKRGIRFVFLSSCESAQQEFIYHLAQAKIPAIMGHLFKVLDPKARDYAESFYRHLLSGQEKSLEYACLEAKQEMHAIDKESPIWASPVLVVQVGV